MAVSEIYDHRGDLIRRIHVEDPIDALSVFTLETVQDIEPVLAFTKAMRDVQQNGNFRYVGSMPVAQAEAMMRDGSFHDPKAIARFFNDADHALLRGTDGRV